MAVIKGFCCPVGYVHWIPRRFCSQANINPFVSSLLVRRQIFCLGILLWCKIESRGKGCVLLSITYVSSQGDAAAKRARIHSLCSARMDILSGNKGLARSRVNRGGLRRPVSSRGVASQANMNQFVSPFRS